MASIEYITKRIAGKQKEIEKLTKKLERIEKAEATGWEVNPYYYSESDKRYTLKDLEAAREALKKYEAELVSANEKAESRSVPAIIEFLEAWKTRCHDFYLEGLSRYFAEKAKVRELGRECEKHRYGTEEREAAEKAYEAAHKALYRKLHGEWKEWEEIRNGRKYRGTTKVAEGEYEAYRPYTNFQNLTEAMEKTDKDLAEEANRKYDFIIERTNALIGKILDASALKVGAKDDLNGYIKGERGTAKVQTIGAGGYNIQIFHFRTLIHKI